jgi:hypothetical protein
MREEFDHSLNTFLVPSAEPTCEVRNVCSFTLYFNIIYADEFHVSEGLYAKLFMPTMYIKVEDLSSTHLI